MKLQANQPESQLFPRQHATPDENEPIEEFSTPMTPESFDKDNFHEDLLKKNESEIGYEQPTPRNHDSVDEQIYEEFSPNAPWQQELVAWLMAREFGNALPLGTRPLPQASHSLSAEESSSPALSFMPSNLAQRASLVLSRINASSPSTKILVDVDQPKINTNSAYSSLKKRKNTTVVPLIPMNELDRDFLSLFGVKAETDTTRRRSDSFVPHNFENSFISDIPDNDINTAEEDHICEEFSVVSMRKNQPVRISIDRQDGSLCWIANTDKSSRPNVDSSNTANTRIHRRLLAIDILRANVDVKHPNVIHLAVIPNHQYSKDSPFSYTCDSSQAAVALVTCVAKTVDAYSSNILLSAKLGSYSGVLCVGKILFRQQSLQPWTSSYAIVTESRHLIVIRRGVDMTLQPDSSQIEHCIDLRYIRELRQESAGDADGSRLLFLRFGSSSASTLYVKPICACTSVNNCACSATGCDPCGVQFNSWQSVLENLIFDQSTKSRCLFEQRMSESDLPAVVDRILSHLTLCYLTTEGLHRQAGRLRVANDLLAQFRVDPWSVRFETVAKDGELVLAHDIVSVLKKFFQSMEKPLLLTGIDEEAEKMLATAWISAHYSRSGVETRLAEYRSAFGMLHPVARRTLQALLLHLRTVAALEAQNRMNFLALAASWGPTLLCSQNPTTTPNGSVPPGSTLNLADILPHGKSVVAGAIGVIIDLLSEMDSICPIETMSESVRRDAHVQDIAVRLHLQPQQRKQAGEITLQIEVDLTTVKKLKPQEILSSFTSFETSLHSKRRTSHSVQISPRLTASDLIKQLSLVDEGIAEFSADLCVWEFLAGGSLRRPLASNTRLLDVCCSWANVEPENLRTDCKFVIEATPLETEESSLYVLTDSSSTTGSNLENESILTFKTSIPCYYSGTWVPDSFSEVGTKLKHWLFVNDSELMVKSLKSAPSALMSASQPSDEKPRPKAGISQATSTASSSNSNNISTASGGGRPHGSFKHFWTSAFQHINNHRAASTGRVKLNVKLNEIMGVYAVHRADVEVAGCGTSGIVVCASPQNNDKPTYHAIHLLNDATRDRLTSYFYSLNQAATYAVNEAKSVANEQPLPILL